MAGQERRFEFSAQCVPDGEDQGEVRVRIDDIFTSALAGDEACDVFLEIWQVEVRIDPVYWECH